MFKKKPTKEEHQKKLMELRKIITESFPEYSIEREEITFREYGNNAEISIHLKGEYR